jgi:3-hydroxyisobutyrate dehydrogenase-like beta-hydroxyacid dehydrogenase
MNASTLGFIGLGVMGEPMCGNLARRVGLPVVATDLKPLPLERLAADGVRAMASVAEVAAAADIVFLSLPSVAEVEAVCFGPGGLVNAPGRRVATIVDMSTSDVVRTRQLAERLAAAGIAFADAPVARTREAARLGTLLITVGAGDEQFAALKPLLACMGSDVVHCGPTGCGQVVKIMNNMVLLITVNALAEALAIGRAAGVDGKLLLETLSMGSADSFALRGPGLKALVPGVFPEQAFPTDYALKDMRLALELARSGSVPVASATATTDLLARTSQAGHGSLYYPAIYKLLA